MKLTAEQKNALLDVYRTAKEQDKFIETSKAHIKDHRQNKRSAYLKNKHIIDEVFYSEMAHA